MLVERFFRDQTGRDACARYGLDLLDNTAHLVRARSVAVAAAQCVYMARLSEVMGVRGFQYSVIPGKGKIVHLVLSIAFPNILEAYVSRSGLEMEDYRRYVREALNWLKSNGVLNLSPERPINDDEVLMTSEELAYGGVHFVVSAFRQMLGRNSEEALSRAIVLTEHNLLSYKLHVWGVADAIVEDPESGRAVIIEWKTYPGDSRKTPQVTWVDIAQAYVYALLETERLGLTDLHSDFEEYVRYVLGSPPSGDGARVIPGVVRPSPSGRASRVYAKHPLYCVGGSTGHRGCDYEGLRDLLARIVLAAEHLTLAVTDIRRLSGWRIIEDLCMVPREERERPVFRLTPEIELEGRRVWLPHGNPLRESLTWPCIACPSAVREACVYFMRSGIDPMYEDFRRYRNEAWRARFAVYEHRENALKPYRDFLRMALDFGPNMTWIRGRLRRRVLPDGSRMDFFDEASIEDDEVVLVRPPMRWEIENSHLFTLREGKPVAVYFNEDHVSYPLHRLSFHGSVSSVEYDGEINRVIVRVAPANKPSRIYPKILETHYRRRPRIFRDVVALEVNVELTQLELLGIAAAEMGTIRRAARAREKLARGEELAEEDLLALLFAGVSLSSGGD